MAASPSEFTYPEWAVYNPSSIYPELEAELVVDGKYRFRVFLGLEVIETNYSSQAYIGTGGSSEVYSAIEIATGEPVAIKRQCLSIRQFSSPASEAHIHDSFHGLYNEFHCLQRARSIPGIPAVYDLFLTLDQGQEGSYVAYLVMQLIQTAGGEDDTLETQQDGGTFDAKQIKPLFRWLLQTTAALHALDICYGDFKRMNTLLDTEGRPWLIDFGQACWVGEGSDQAQGVTCWVPGCVWPARVPLTKAADTFGLGQLLFQILHQGERSSAGLLGGDRVTAEAWLAANLDPAGSIYDKIIWELFQWDEADRPNSGRLNELATLL